jgi:hypothetical protein
MAVAANWRETAANLVPGWLRDYWGTRFVGFIALLADAISQGASEALRAPWPKESTSPDDALGMFGHDSNMPQYPAESAATYRTRLVGNEDGTGGRWDAWKFAGNEVTLLAQIHALGFTDAEIVTSHNASYSGVASWSRFQLILPEGSHGWTADTSLWDSGSPKWDEDPTRLWDVVEDVPGEVRALRDLLRRFKAAHEVCDSIIAIVSGRVWDFPADALWDVAPPTWDVPPTVVIRLSGTGV